MNSTAAAPLATEATKATVARRTGLVRRLSSLTAVAALTAAGSAVAVAGSAQAATTNLYVSPTGSNTNAGTSVTAPLKTIQAALNIAKPGTVVNLGAGVYNETPHTVVDGTAVAPIVVQGPETGTAIAGRYIATLTGTGRLMNVDNSYYTFRGFTIDGEQLLKTADYPTALADATAFKTKSVSKVNDGRLIYIGSNDTDRNLTGITVDNMWLRGAGGECVRIRNASSNVTISNSQISWCGLYGKSISGVYQFHNGEGVYVGTSPKSTDQPMYSNDTTHAVTLTNDVVHTFGSECVDVKENSSNVTLNGVDCADNTEPLADSGANIELRGHDNTVVNSTVSDSAGYNVKVTADSSAYNNTGNSIRTSSFARAGGASFAISSTGQGAVCGDTFDSTNVLSNKMVLTPTVACL